MTTTLNATAETQAPGTIQKHCLRDLRERAKLSIAELARKSGVTDDTISEIENGNPTGRRTNESTARLLCAALGVKESAIVWPNGGYTTNVGRPANSTGPSTGPVNVSKRSERKCPVCFMYTPADIDECIRCL